MKLTENQLRDFSATILAMTDMEELKSLNQMIVERSKILQNRVVSSAKANLKVGSNVYWDSKKIGERVEGVVQKINTKNVIVKTSLGLFNVSPTILKLGNN